MSVSVGIVLLYLEGGVKVNGVYQMIVSFNGNPSR